MDKKTRDIYEYELRFGSRVVYSSFFFRFIAWIHARASRFQIDGRLDDESGEPNMVRKHIGIHVFWGPSWVLTMTLVQGFACKNEKIVHPAKS